MPHRPALLALVPTLLFAGFACGGSAPPPAPPAPPPVAEHPDLVFITLDTTRADHLGLYGYPRDTSPVLDRLGASSVVFERLQVPMATTLPTHVSLFSAVWPEEHGVLANLAHGGERWVPGSGLTLFADWATKAADYDTAAFVSSRVLAPETGLDAGFATYEAPRRPERTADRTIDDAIAWWQGRPEDGRPRLLWVHLFDPHNPYAPPPGHRDVFSGADPALDSWIAARRHSPQGSRPTGEVVVTDRAIPLYDAEIRFMDAQIGRLLQVLQDSPRWEDDIAVVVAGDHGEGLNQHGEPGHGLVWQEQLHAPLIMRLPGRIPSRPRTLLSMADVLPTLLGAIDLPGEADFLAQASGTDVLAPDFAPREVLSMRSPRQESFGKTMVRVLTGERFKCRVPEDGAPSLYDLDLDPWELDPVDDPDRLAACVASLERTLAQQQQRHATLGGHATAPLDPGDAAALEALGYVAPDAPSPPPSQPTTDASAGTPSEAPSQAPIGPAPPPATP